VIVAIDPHKLPLMAGNRLYLDYISGATQAQQFFTHAPRDFAAALAGRRGYEYPREQVAGLLAAYNRDLGAHPRALDNIESLRDPGTFCVISGQQAGFMGGPVYTAYKIATTIRLAARLQEQFGQPFIPLFWLATEDHDFNEINHTYFVKEDGEIGRIKFDWDQVGHPVSHLVVDAQVERAYVDYLEQAISGPHAGLIGDWFAPRSGENFGYWQARTWSRLFSDRGLVIVEPRVLRPAGGEFMRFSLEHAAEIRSRLDDVAAQLLACGYSPALDSPQVGELYTFDAQGVRVRVGAVQTSLDHVLDHPQAYSTDAALRPLFADALLPIVVSILGPGETAYQAMLRPLYDLFGLPQPLILPRQSYTVASARDAERLAQYRVRVEEVLTGQLDDDTIFGGLVPDSEKELFVAARQSIERGMEPLRPYLEGIDPSLGRTWEQTVVNVTRGLDKLEERSLKARLSQLGFSKGELRSLVNALLPRGRFQERILPLPHFVSRYGPDFIEQILRAGQLDQFAHCVIVMEDGHA
jgi:bacillithiol biosynthesis cysteine-adding enzyme BshC